MTASAAVGMRRVPAGESAFFYDDLAAKLLAQGRIEYDRDGFREMAERENILDLNARPDETLTIGIRSFIASDRPARRTVRPDAQSRSTFRRTLHTQ